MGLIWGGIYDARLTRKEFKENAHPRAPKGSKGRHAGGRFVPKGMVMPFHRDPANEFKMTTQGRAMIQPESVPDFTVQQQYHRPYNKPEADTEDAVLWEAARLQWKAAATAEAERWARSEMPEIKWDLSDIDPDLLRPIVQEFVRLRNDFGSLDSYINGVSTEYPGEKPNSPKANTYAHWAGGDELQIVLNPVWFGDMEKYQTQLFIDSSIGEGLASAWCPVGRGRPESTISHEFGHALRERIGRGDNAFQKYYRASGFGFWSETMYLFDDANAGNVGELSQYAKTSKSEAFAEGFSQMRSVSKESWATYTKHLSKLIKAVLFDNDAMPMRDAAEWRDINADGGDSQLEYKRALKLARSMGIKEI